MKMQIVHEIETMGPLEYVERLFGNHDDGVLAFDFELRFLYWNPAMEALTGLAKCDVLGRRVLDLLPSLGGTYDSACLEGALRGQCSVLPGITFDPEAGLRYGTESAARAGAHEVYYAPLHGPEGSIIGGTAIVRNAEQRNVIEQRLRETERRFRTMADSAPVLLWMSGTDALCDFFNQGWLDFTGRTLEQEKGVGWAEGVHAEDFQGCMDLYMASFSARQPFEMIYRLRRGDGEYRWILDRGTPRWTPDGAFAGYIGSCIDITDRKVAEDVLKKSADDLTHANLELERFVHVASHDLQEPIRMVANFTELLARKCSGTIDEQAREYITYAVDGANRMKDLIDGLLAHSRIGRPAKTFLPADCTAVLEEALADLRLYADEAGALISRDPLPTVMGDKVYLGQLLRNLIQNSIKFHGSAPPRIHVGAVLKGPMWLFSVQDNGLGFDMRFAERIFTIFQRLNPREEFSGNGVGLSICKRIVELHGGRIWAESKPGAGSTFFFTLPA